MNFELLRIAIALAFTAVLAYQDYKTSFVDEKILYAMIAAGIILNLISLDLSLIAFTIGGALLITGVGYFLYKHGQFGAGDILLFAALQLLLPQFPTEITKYTSAFIPLAMNNFYTSTAQIFPFFFAVFTTAALLALIISSIHYAWKLVEKKTKWKPETNKLTIASVAALVFLFWSAAFQLSVLALVVITVTLASAVFSITMKQQIMKDVIVQHIPIREIEDEDVLAIEEMNAKMIKKYKIEKVLTKENVEKLKKIHRETGTKLFPVYKNLPRFVPYVLAAVIICLLVINPLAFILFA